VRVLDAAAARLEEDADISQWTVTAAAGHGGREPKLVLPVGRFEACVLSRFSCAAAWMGDNEVSFTGERLLLVGPEGTADQALDLDMGGPRACALSGGKGEYVLTINLASRGAEPGRVRGALRAGREALPAYRELSRDVACEEAAHSFVGLFALLDLVPPSAFGRPTAEQSRVLRSLAETRAALRNLFNANDFHFLPDPPSGGPAGYVATWRHERFVALHGSCGSIPFPGGAPFWRLVGEGEVTLVFSEDCKGFTVYTYDSYGRPREVWGGPGGTSHRFCLCAGEQITIDQG
jgi:hypothetical protein